MNTSCPRCHTSNRGEARYCSRCGLPLATEDGRLIRAGFVGHRYPLPPPPGFEPFTSGTHLYHRFESAWGGQRLLGTEGISLVLMNGGYGLRDAVIRVEGRSEAGESLFECEYSVAELPRGKETNVEVPSYDVPAPVHSLRVSLLGASFAPATEEVA